MRKVIKLEKNEIWESENVVSKNMGFVNYGILRQYYIKNGDEYTDNFFVEKDFTGNYISHLSNEPSRSFTVAIEPCELVVMSFLQLEKHNHLNINNSLLFSKKLLEQNEFDKIFSLLYPYFNENKLSIEGIQILLNVALELNNLNFYLEVSEVIHKKYPFSPLSHEILINALMQNKNYNEASKIIIKAKNRFPNYYNFLIFEAKIAVVSDKLLNAINIYNYILKQDNSLVDVKHDLALLYNKIEKYELCDDIFLELLNIDTDNLIFISEFSSIISNRVTSTYEELKYALKLVEYGLDIYVGNSTLLDNYGWINYKLGNYDLALDYVNQSLSIKNNQNVLNHLIEILKNNENENNKVDFNKR